MKFIDFSAETDILPVDFLELYTEAFPSAERRGWKIPKEVTEFALSHPDMHIRIAMEGENLAGFIIYWMLTPEVVYVEHLVVNPALRGGGLGARLLTSVLDDTGAESVLEVEPPCDELSRRRVGFYRRLGFNLHSDIDYMQPSYTPHGEECRLNLMTTPGISSAQLTEEIIPLLRRKIYNRK